MNETSKSLNFVKFLLRQNRSTKTTTGWVGKEAKAKEKQIKQTSK